MSTTPTLNIFYAPDKPEESPIDLSFLRLAVAPLPPAPTPTDANAQDIVFLVPDGSVCLLTFDIADPDLIARVAQECDALYAVFGTEGVECFHKGLFFQWLVSPFSDFYSPAITNVIQSHKLRGEGSYIDAVQTPKRAALLKAFEKRAEELKNFVETVIGKFQKAAQIQADRKVQESIKDLFQEAYRYLGGHAYAPTPQEPSDAPPPMVREDATLDGKDLSGLAEALTQIQKAITALEQVQTAYVAKWPPGSPSGGTPLPEEQLQQQLAAQDLQQKGDVLAKTIIETCRVYPILYRLWNTPITSMVATIWNETPKSSRLEILKSNETVRVWLIDLIDKTAQAAQEFQVSFRQDATLAWKYDRVIYATLHSLGLAQGDLAYRAVEDKLRSTQSQTSQLSNLSAAAQNLDLLATILGVAAPEIALLATALFGAEIIEKIISEAEKDAAFNACLDPGKSLVTEPGSFGSALIDGLFLLLALKHAPKQVSALLK